MQAAFKHAIITGGSSGIGKAVAVLLMKQGTHLTIIGRDLEKLKQTEKELLNYRPASDLNQKLLIISADVSNQAQIAEAIAQAVGENGAPDLLINSAGVAEPGYFDEQPSQTYIDAMNTNYFGTLFAIKAVMPLMKREGRGQIVIVSSVAGIVGVFGYSAYCPSKFAVRGLAEVIRSELKRDNIYISVLYPPDTDTPGFHKENETKPLETKLISNTLKIWTAEDIAKTLLNGVQKKKFTIIPGFTNRCLFVLSSLFYPFIHRYMDYCVSRVKNGDGEVNEKNN